MTRREPFFPKYKFALPVGPCLPFFAWWPTRLYDGRVLWLRRGWRQLMVMHSYLPTGGDTFWAYTDILSGGLDE